MNYCVGADGTVTVTVWVGVRMVGTLDFPDWSTALHLSGDFPVVRVFAQEDEG